MATVAYAELHCISNFSFLRGASHPGELVLQAAKLGYSAIAITDECSLAGIVKAHVAAKECRIQLIVGSEFVLEEGLRLVLLAPDRDAYAQLSTLITVARRRSVKGEYSLALKDLKRGAGEQLAIWLPGYQEPLNDHYSEDLKLLFNNRLWIGFNNLINDSSAKRYRYFKAL
ncbi:MAG: PHP domain-containing protein, partial [Pseudomonadota bacterium]